MLRAISAALVAAILAGCSGGAASSPASVAPTPTAVPVSIETPSGGPTFTPVTPQPLPTNPPLAGMSYCSHTNGNPGTYLSFATTGNVIGHVYSEDTSAANTYTVTSYVTEPPGYPTATPVPTSSTSPGLGVSPTPTPSPTNVPYATPTPMATPPTPTPAPPTAIPTPSLGTYYSGTYTIPTFSGTTPGTSSLYTVGAFTGCIALFLLQSETGTAGQARRAASSASVDNTFAVGDAVVTVPYTIDTVVDSGTIASFTITNLTPTTGTGTFTLQNGVVGTVTIDGSYSQYNGSVVRRGHSP